MKGVLDVSSGRFDEIDWREPTDRRPSAHQSSLERSGNTDRLHGPLLKQNKDEKLG